MKDRWALVGIRARRALRAGALVLAVAVSTTVPVALAPAARASDTAPYRATVFTRGYDRSKVVTLSFDSDWPTADNARSKANLARVRQVLADNGVTAGFGLTGRFVENNAADARALAAAGHKLINHSYNHPDFMTLTQAQRWSQLDRAEAAYRAAGLTSAGWFRAPYGSGNLDPGVNRDLALRRYYVSFDWTFDTTGYRASPWSVISARIAKYTVPGAIIVMHLSAPSTDPTYLPQIISKLRGMGYSFTSPYVATTRGAIRSRYLALGGPAAYGAPTTAEQVATTAGTAVQWFQRCRIYWSQASGAHEVHGAILTKYLSLGGVSSFLRFPLSDEAGVTRGRASRFQGGTIYWSSSTGAHEVHGAILRRYLSLGGTGSGLGLPVTDEFSVSAGRRSNFQHGAIVWNARTNTTSVIYY